MFQLMPWVPAVAGVLLLGFGLLTDRGRRTSLTRLVLIEFAVGLGSSFLSVELFLGALETVELPADLFGAGVRAGWTPTLWAFLVALALTVILRTSRGTRERDRSHHRSDSRQSSV